MACRMREVDEVVEWIHVYGRQAYEKEWHEDAFADATLVLGVRLGLDCSSIRKGIQYISRHETRFRSYIFNMLSEAHLGGDLKFHAQTAPQESVCTGGL